ncbi:MAG: choice-of-anchor Q domain-containing protein [Chloroflexota bacterium]
MRHLPRVCNPLALAAALLVALVAPGAQPVRAAATITVRSLADSGGTCPGADCTLRQAIAVANAGDTIDFSVPTPATIELTSGELLVTKSLAIKGPGAHLLAISGGHASRVFKMFDAYFHTMRSKFSIEDITITRGRATATMPGDLGRPGGGILAYGDLELRRVIVEDNHAVAEATAIYADGGGLALWKGDLSVEDAIFRNNSAERHPSAVPTAGADGGAISVSGWEANFVGSFPIRISRTTFVGNRANDHGGAVSSSRAASFTNTTISGNSTLDPTRGGWNGGGVSMLAHSRVVHSTIVFNRTPAHGVLFGGDFSGAAGYQANARNGGTPEMVNTIVAHNYAGDTPSNCNYSSDNTSVIDFPKSVGLCSYPEGSTTNADPKLAPLVDNGGFAPTHALLPGSAAVGAARCTREVPTDQRGVPRPVAEGCDIGAFQTTTTNLGVTLVPGKRTAVAGEQSYYVVTITNQGPSGVMNAPITVELPPGLASATWSCLAGERARCGTPGGAGSIADSATVPYGSTVRYTIVGTVAIDATGSIDIHATARTPSYLVDTDGADNEASISQLLVPRSRSDSVGTAPTVPTHRTMGSPEPLIPSPGPTRR